MTKIKITDRQLILARNKANKIGQLKNSIKKGSNLVGCLGEMIANKVLKGKFRNTYNYDLVKDGKKYDVKTKKCSTEPLDYYLCSVSTKNTKQLCDYYLFTRVLDDYSAGWVLGYISKDDFYKNATFCKKGDADPQRKGWTFKSDCYSIKISDLIPL